VPPFSSDEFRQALAGLPTGVTVVTAPSPDGPLGATANAVSSLSLEPPLMLASLDVGSRTLAAVRAAGLFGVSVLGEEHEPIARAFATKAPHAEKWADVPSQERAGVPVIAGVPLWVACELRESHAEGDHVILIGGVTDLGGEGGGALVFHRGDYRSLPG
jgi:3-hydroxy-9,10-secoandrosta-1,3,5(10)-triene-9,17-dione monooxygenase reductase component